MNYLIENKELAIISLIVGLFLPLAVHKIYSAICWCLTKVVCFWGNPYGTGLLIGFFVATQFFWLQQWIFAYNEVVQHENPYNRFAYAPVTVAIPMFFANIALIIISAIRTICLVEKRQ